MKDQSLKGGVRVERETKKQEACENCGGVGSYVTGDAPHDELHTFREACLICGGRVYLPRVIADEFQISTSEARRLQVQGAVKIDGALPLSFDYDRDTLAGRTLTIGKRRSLTFDAQGNPEKADA